MTGATVGRRATYCFNGIAIPYMTFPEAGGVVAVHVGGRLVGTVPAESSVDELLRSVLWSERDRIIAPEPDEWDAEVMTDERESYERSLRATRILARQEYDEWQDLQEQADSQEAVYDSAVDDFNEARDDLVEWYAEHGAGETLLDTIRKLQWDDPMPDALTGHAS